MPKNLTYVAVGNPKEFGTPLASLGIKVEPIDLTIPEPKPEAAQAPPPTPATLAKGKELLQRVQQALGGTDKLAAVKDLQYHAEVEAFTPGVSIKVKQTDSFIAPSIIRQDNELPVFKQSEYYDGKSGWLASVQGIRGLTQPLINQIRGEAFRRMAEPDDERSRRRSHGHLRSRRCT